MNEYMEGYMNGFMNGHEAAMPKWISVDERLPEIGQKVMVCGLHNGIQVGAFGGLSIHTRNGNWWWKKNTILRVTHWMPLPEPPKGCV